MSEYPVRSVLIKGATAKAVVGALRAGEATSFRTVREAADVDKEMGNPADEHHCPLCNDFFGWEAFKAHAPQCIKRFRAGRNHIWTPPGFSPNAVQHYDNPVKVV